MHKSKAGISKRKLKHKHVVRSLAEREEHYNLLLSLAQADSGINIGPFLRGNAKAAEAVAQCIFGGHTGKRVLSATVGCPPSERADKDSKITDDPKQLRLVAIIVIGTFLRVLFYSGTVSNAMSSDLRNCLHLQPRSTNRRMRIADGTETGAIGKVTKVAVTVGDSNYQMTSLVVNCAPFRFIVGRPAMKYMKVSLDFDRDVFIFLREGQTVNVPLWTDEKAENILIEKFTSSDKE